MARDLLDEGQFGAALVFTPSITGAGASTAPRSPEATASDNLSAYVNFAYSRRAGDQGRDRAVQFRSRRARLHQQPLRVPRSRPDLHLVWRCSLPLERLRVQRSIIYTAAACVSGFANTGNLPFYIQANAGVTRRFAVPYVGWIEARLDCINLFDRTYLIRDGSGIGVGAPQYGPRRAVFAGVRVPLPWGDRTAGS